MEERRTGAWFALAAALAFPAWACDPGLGGVRLESPRTGVVLVSGVLEPQAHLPGGVRFLTKPVKASTLLRLLREVADPRAKLPEPTQDELP